MPVLLEILQIVVPALLIVGGGGIAYWKFLRQQAVDKNKDNNALNKELRQQLAEYVLTAEKEVWSNVEQTMKRQSLKLAEQEAKMAVLEEEFAKCQICISELQKEYGDCRKYTTLLESQNHSLAQENQVLKELLDE